MTLRRTRIWLIALALPVAVIAVVATSMVASRYHTACDELGSWNLTIRDSHGVPIGHGHLELVAARWNTHWTRAVPFVAVVPTLADDAGRFTLDATGAATLNHDLPLMNAAMPHDPGVQTTSPTCLPGEFPLSTTKYADGKGMVSLNLAPGCSLNFDFDERRPPKVPNPNAYGYDRPEYAFFLYSVDLSR